MKTWVQLSQAEKDQAGRDMIACRGFSRNGVSGWYHTQRMSSLYAERKSQKGFKKLNPHLLKRRQATDLRVQEGPLEMTTLEELGDII